MNVHDLIRDPLFQLNVLIWMAKEQPSSGYVVRPLFFQNGFRLVYIQQPFPFPPESIRAIQSSDLDVSKQPEPELLFGRSSDRRALYFEAKAESFSPQSSTAKQARGHLLATGDVFAEVLAPLQSCLLCYVVPEKSRAPMFDCLVELTQQMTDGGFRVGEFSVHGFEVQDQDLQYWWDDRFKQHVGVDDDYAVVMTGLTDDTDPNPLLLVYSAEDYPDPDKQDLLRRTLVNQVHALLLCALNALPPNTQHDCSAETVLKELTDGVYDYVGRKGQKQMRRLVRRNVFRRIADFATDRFDDVISFEGGVLGVRFPTKDRKSSFLEWLEDSGKTGFSTERVSEDPQRRLFGDEAED